MSDCAEKTAVQQRGRPFPKGKSGNPRGRPHGSRNKATIAALNLLDGEAVALTRKAVELALDGEIAALRLCIERLIPIRRESVDINMTQTEVRIDLRQIAASELSALESFLERVLTSGDVMDPHDE
jgi:hypothetical protein